MRLFFVKILFLLFCPVGITQNLVPNFSFENYTFCPTNSGQINYAFPWVGQTSGSTPDYFNSCSMSGYGVPQHGAIGFQFPNSGDGYAGVWLFGSGINYREYLQVQLDSSLVSGECYLITYFVNLFNDMKFAVSSVDAHLSTSQIDTTGDGYLLNLIPQITNFSTSPLSDTLNWIKISSIFVSLGGEQYITIGNFNNDQNTDTLNTGFSYYGSYYYIDDVSVIPIDSILGSMPAFAGNDTLIMEGDSIFIGQEITNLNCNWYDEQGTLIDTNISGIYVQPDTTTFYVVEQNLCGSITYDTVLISVSPVGIEELNNALQFSIYPNPNAGIFTILPYGSEISTIELEVFDFSGKTIYSKNVNANNGAFEMQLNVPDGIYSVRIFNSETGQMVIKRISVLK